MKAKVYCNKHNKMEIVKIIRFVGNTIAIDSTVDCRKIISLDRIQELLVK